MPFSNDNKILPSCIVNPSEKFTKPDSVKTNHRLKKKKKKRQPKTGRPEKNFTLEKLCFSQTEQEWHTETQGLGGHGGRLAGTTIYILNFIFISCLECQSARPPVSLSVSFAPPPPVLFSKNPSVSHEAQ